MVGFFGFGLVRFWWLWVFIVFFGGLFGLLNEVVLVDIVMFVVVMVLVVLVSILC